MKKKPLYVCFVDFKKAFDTVTHNILWSKLLGYGVEGKFLELIKSMYSKVKSCVRSDEGLTNLVLYKRGLRQGCLLSPLPFALFLNDINKFLLEKAEGITLWDERLCALLYADDPILIAESKEDLQIQLYALGIYANSIKMEINEKKRKVLIFRKRKITKDNEHRNWQQNNRRSKMLQIFRRYL